MAETTSRNARKVRTGVVVSISGDKSITVKIDYRKHHPKYGKMMTISKKLHCHDEKNECGLGDTVTVMEPRSRSLALTGMMFPLRSSSAPSKY